MSCSSTLRWLYSNPLLFALTSQSTSTCHLYSFRWHPSSLVSTNSTCQSLIEVEGSSISIKIFQYSSPLTVSHILASSIQIHHSLNWTAWIIWLALLPVERSSYSMTRSAGLKWTSRLLKMIWRLRMIDSPRITIFAASNICSTNWKHSLSRWILFSSGSRFPPWHLRVVFARLLYHSLAFKFDLSNPFYLILVHRFYVSK
jgi:hypothetical protein